MDPQERLAERLRVHLQQLEETKKLARAAELYDAEQSIAEVIKKLREVTIQS